MAGCRPLVLLVHYIPPFLPLDIQNSLGKHHTFSTYSQNRSQFTKSPNRSNCLHICAVSMTLYSYSCRCTCPASQPLPGHMFDGLFFSMLQCFKGLHSGPFFHQPLLDLVLGPLPPLLLILQRPIVLPGRSVCHTINIDLIKHLKPS